MVMEICMIKAMLVVMIVMVRIRMVVVWRW